MAGASPVPWLLLLLFVAAVTAEGVNKSASGGLFWSTAKEEADLARKPDAEDDLAAPVVDDRDGIDGGFSSLDGMLQWAIGKLHYGRFISVVCVLIISVRFQSLNEPISTAEEHEFSKSD